MSGIAVRNVPRASAAEVEALARFAESKGRTLLELAFGWLLASPAVASVIAGARSEAQIAANAAAAGWQLTADQVAAVNRMVATA